MSSIDRARAFSGEVGTGSPQKNATTAEPLYAPDCYWAAQPVVDAWGEVVSYVGEPVQVCPGYVADVEPPPPPEDVAPPVALPPK